MSEEIINNITTPQSGGGDETPVTVLSDNGYVFDGKYGPIPNADGSVDLSNYAEKYINNTNRGIIEQPSEIEIIPDENAEYLNEVFTNSDYKVTNMEMFFYNLPRLISIDNLSLSHWDTSNVTNMGGAFYTCSSLTSLDLSKWDTSKVTNMNNMFSFCTTLTSLDISNWDTSNVTDMNLMFYQCYSLKNIDGILNLSSINDKNKSNLFYQCNALTSATIALPFYGEITKDDILSTVTPDSAKSAITFIYSYPLIRNYIAYADTAKKEYNFDGVYGPIPNVDGTVDLSYYASKYIANYINNYQLPAKNKEYLDIVLTTDKYKVINMSHMFDGCYGLKSLDVSNWDTSNVTDMSHMFDGCYTLTTITGTIDLTSCRSYEDMLFTSIYVENENGDVDIDWSHALTSVYIKLPSTISQSAFLSNSGVTNESAVHFVS